jgi:DNA-binding Lrp family transcriptional regulator
MTKLDVKDRKLLYYLSRDCRMSHTQLSKRIALSKNAVKYRIDRLQKEGIVKKFASVVNLGAMGLNTVTLLLRFNEDVYEKTEIIEYFKNHFFANWVVTLSGQWDIFVEFVVRDLSHLKDLIDEILFSQNIQTYRMFFSMETLRVEHLVADFYEDLKLEELPRKERQASISKVDDTDKHILRILNEDSSLPYLQIAQKMESTIDVVRYRMKNLTQKGILVKNFSEIDLKKLGYTEYLYTMSLRNLTEEKKEQMIKRVQTNSNITYAFFDITGFNIVFVCAFKSSVGIDHLSRSLRKEFTDVIEEQDYHIIKEQVLFNLFPKGV